jgi:hypothetical protein
MRAMQRFRTALMVFAGVAFALAGWGPAHAQGGRAVDLELVLAIDTSTSVDDREFRLQRDGLADAFLHPDVVGAIRAAGDLGIAVTLVEWSGERRQATVAEWAHVHDATSAAVFSAAIRAAPRALSGFTDIAGAIRFSVARLADNAFVGRRLVIDVSGDGSSDPVSSERERDQAVAYGITVNGLVIYNEDIDLGELANIDVRDHYANHVIGGIAAFMMTADDFTDFRTAIRRKLVREITGPATAELRPVR